MKQCGSEMTQYVHDLLSGRVHLFTFIQLGLCVAGKRCCILKSKHELSYHFIFSCVPFVFYFEHVPHSPLNTPHTLRHAHRHIIIADAEDRVTHMQQQHIHMGI